MSRTCVCAAILAAAGVASIANAELVYGITQTGFLSNWDSSSPNVINGAVAIQGLKTNETLIGIDFRPATGQLYGLGSFSNLYVVDITNGWCTQKGGTFSTPLNGSSFGFDFNPTVDRIRIISDANQNLRVNPITGAVAAVDGSHNYAMGDMHEGMDPNVVHAAYTNNFKGATSTTLYVIDTGFDTLATQIPPNSGTLNTVGSIGTDVSDIGGFDISGSTGIAYLTIRDAMLGKSTFWTINLANGSASAVGEIGGGSIITAMAVTPAPGAIGVLAAAGAFSLRRRRA